jgi:signal transduction histidine kinase
MKKRICCVVVIFLMTAGLVWAQEKRGSAAQAKLMIDKGYEYVQKHGVKAAIAEFNKPDGKFIKDDLFIWVVDFDGVIHAYAPNQKNVRKKDGLRLRLKDAEGKLFLKDMVTVAQTKGFGWVDYKYMNPKTKKIEQKTTYVKKMSDNMLMACGAYK